MERDSGVAHARMELYSSMGSQHGRNSWAVM